VRKYLFQNADRGENTRIPVSHGGGDEDDVWWPYLLDGLLEYVLGHSIPLVEAGNILVDTWLGDIFEIILAASLLIRSRCGFEIDAVSVHAVEKRNLETHFFEHAGNDEQAEWLVPKIKSLEVIDPGVYE
jgi:hypothetical protein